MADLLPIETLIGKVVLRYRVDQKQPGDDWQSVNEQQIEIDAARDGLSVTDAELDAYLSHGGRLAALVVKVKTMDRASEKIRLESYLYAGETGINVDGTQTQPSKRLRTLQSLIVNHFPASTRPVSIPESVTLRWPVSRKAIIETVSLLSGLRPNGESQSLSDPLSTATLRPWHSRRRRPRPNVVRHQSR